jgi:hypothetical protein
VIGINEVKEKIVFMSTHKGFDNKHTIKEINFKMIFDKK